MVVHEVSWGLLCLSSPKSSFLCFFPVLLHYGRSDEEANAGETDDEKEGG